MSGHPRNETAHAAAVRRYAETGIAHALDELSRTASGVNVALNEQAFGVQGELLTYTMPQVVLDQDDEDDDITACVIDAKVAKPTRAPRPPKAGSKAALVLNEFAHCLLASKGRAVVGHDRIPDNAVVVTHADLLAACRARGLGHSNDPDPKEREKVERRAIERGIEGAEKAGYLARFMYRDELVYWQPRFQEEKGNDFNAGSTGSNGVKNNLAPNSSSRGIPDTAPSSGVKWGQTEKPNDFSVGSSGSTRVKIIVNRPDLAEGRRGQPGVTPTG